MFYQFMLKFIFCIFYLKQCISINPETLKEISASTIKKCKCEQGFALSGPDCLESENPIRIWDNRDQIVTLVNISDFNSVVVKPLKCGDGFSKLKLSLTEFIVQPNGYLFNSVIESGYEIRDYCLEHTLQQTDQPLTIIAQVCQLNPAVHWCCPLDHVKKGNECIPIDENHNPDSLPLVGGFAWMNFTNTFSKIECAGNTIYKNTELILPADFQKFGAALVGYPIGSLLMYRFSLINEPIFMSNNDYCISFEEQNGIHSYYAEFCIPDARLEHENMCKNVTCVRKCCAPGHAYDVGYGYCIPHPYNFTYNFDNDTFPSNLHQIFGGPLCEEYYFLKNIVNEPINPVLKSDGQLAFQDQDVFSTDYCIDGFVNVTDANHTNYDSAIVCFQAEVEQPCAWRWIAGSILLGISCVFYALTLAVYLMVDELRQRISGKCLISEVSSLLVTYVLLIFLQNSTSHSGVFCNIPGSLAHISILASFFWLNVMCFDMWKTITSNVPVAASRIKGVPENQRRFLFYSLYAWGIPILIGVFRILIDEISPENSDFFLRTTLGKSSCFFSDKDRLAKWIYLYAPIALILFVNTIFFCLVATNIVRVKRKTAKIMKNINSGSKVRDRNRVRNRDKALLYLKLFLVMGLSWVMEIVMFVAVGEMECRFWILDLVNMTQGVFIFLIFVCKKSTLNMIKPKILSHEAHTPSTSTTPITRVKLDNLRRL